MEGVGALHSAKTDGMRIEVRPLNRSKWHGKQGKDSFARPMLIMALVDTDSMQYATGLSTEDIKHLQKKFGVSVNLSPEFNPNEPHPFWDSLQSSVKLEDHTMIFDTDNWMDFIKVSIMKASKYVANSMDSYERGEWPFATHVIYDERADVQAKASLVNMRNSCVLAMSKRSKNDKIQCILIVSGKNMKGASDDHVEVILAELIQEMPHRVQEWLQAKPEENQVRAIVKEALLKNVLQRRGHAIYYYDAMLGMSEEDVRDYLVKPENQDFKIRLLAQIQ